jgi:hypothetical protein
MSHLLLDVTPENTGEKILAFLPAETPDVSMYMY